MTLATYRDLCVDAVDPELLGRFWAAALGRELETREDGMVLLTGPTPRHTIWVNRVPEPVTVKQRVHLDVHASAVEDVLALGAEPVDLTSFRWQVLRDPEGGELCVFEREQVPAERLFEVVVDCAEPERLATWWADLVGGHVLPDPAGDGYALEEVPGMPFECLVFGAVPEPKTVKNRVHWDVDLAPSGSVELLTAYGAELLRPRGEGLGWSVLADPEGNEFCAFGP